MTQDPLTLDVKLKFNKIENPLNQIEFFFFLTSLNQIELAANSLV
jgi:hypothetical protein